MAYLTVKQINEATALLIERHPGGIRYRDMWKWFRENHPETKEGTLAAQLSHVVNVFPERVRKIGHGLYAPVVPNGGVAPVPEPPAVQGVKESDFYGPFAEFLKDDLDEVVYAVPLGGSSMANKWGTPDVVGVYRPTSRDLIKFQPEIVSAEIKLDPREPITAFGQACSYRLFSTKCYAVMPNTMTEVDKSRLEALAMLFGIGLVLFSPKVDAPEFAIRVRAQRFIPDMYYANEFADQLKRVLDTDHFERMFG